MVNHPLMKEHYGFKMSVVLAGAMIFLLATDFAYAGFIQLDGVADVKTRFSRGCSTLQEVAELARAKAIDAVIFGDQARDSLEYGLVPLERIIRKRSENSSVLTVGASAYISEINDNDRQLEETLLISGAEVSPFYYWTGNVFKDTLVANNVGKHLFVVGLNAPELYEQLPILDSNFSKRYFSEYRNVFIGCVALFLLSLFIVLKGYKKKASKLVAGIIFLVAINNMPFRSSPFDQYSGDLGAKPYQELINYVNNTGGLIFWNDMDASNVISQEGRIGYKTEPHPEDLMLTSGYTGFQSIGDSPVVQVEPGQEWDKLLNEYLQGKRKKPIWGYGGNNYLCEDEGAKLGEIRTIFLVREKSRDDVLDAMANGRMYAVRQAGNERLSLDSFTVSDITSGQHAIMGEKLISNDFPELKVKVRLTKGTEKTVSLSVIRNGVEVKQETVELPYEMTWRDVDIKRDEGPVFYRLKVEADSENYLVSNPIFVHFNGGDGTQVASATQSKTEKLSMGEPIEPIEPIKPNISIPKNPNPPLAKPTKLVIDTMFPSVPKILEPKDVITANLTPPTLNQPIPPTVKMPNAPSPLAKFTDRDASVIAKIDGVSLKNGPGPKFPEVGRLNKGDRLALIRKTDVEFNGEPWLLVDLGGRKAYVWSELVSIK
jgi:hypothetical protein